MKIAKKFKIVIYIPIDEDFPTFNTKEEAEAEAGQLAFLQPENKYEVVEFELKDEY